MEIKPENIQIRDKIIEGVNLAYKNLVINSAEKNQKLVISDLNGNVQHVPAKELLKKLSEK